MAGYSRRRGASRGQGAEVDLQRDHVRAGRWADRSRSSRSAPASTAAAKDLTAFGAQKVLVVDDPSLAGLRLRALRADGRGGREGRRLRRRRRHRERVRQGPRAARRREARRRLRAGHRRASWSTAASARYRRPMYAGQRARLARDHDARPGRQRAPERVRGGRAERRREPGRERSRARRTTPRRRASSSSGSRPRRASGPTSARRASSSPAVAR